MAGETIIAVVGNLTADPELRSTKNGRIAQGRLTQHSWEDEQHQKRSSVELQVDEIGPSLRYATAQVAKVQSGTAGAYGNPASMPAGYAGGASASLPPSDPWGQPQNKSASFGDFGKPESEPDF